MTIMSTPLLLLLITLVALAAIVALIYRREMRAARNRADELTLGLEPLRWIDRILKTMHPASLRSRGVAFDDAASLPGKRITAIAAPALIVHAKDDALQLYRNAAFAAPRPRDTSSLTRWREPTSQRSSTS